MNRDPSATPPSTQERLRSSNWDMLSIGSFAVAAGLSIATLCNNIRQKFYHTFVLGHKGVTTSFQDIITRFDGGVNGTEMVEGEFKTLNKAFNAASEAYQAGQLDKKGLEQASKTLRAGIKDAAKEMRLSIAERLLEQHNIPTYGPSGWTVGIVKRWNELGKHARMDTGLGFAAVTAMGVGAVLTIRHSKHTVDRIEDRLHQIDSKETARA